MELNKIYLGDCLEVMKELPSNSIDLVITDPPYTSPVAISFGREICRTLSDLSIQATYSKLLAEEWFRLLKPNGKVLVFCDETYYPVLYTAFYSWQYRQMLVWDKDRIGLGRGFRRQHELLIYATKETNQELNLWPGVSSHKSILRFSPVNITERLHGAEKPIELIEYLIKATTNEGDLVLDPFFGSGVVGVAAKLNNRHFVGIEMEQKYVDVANKRIAECGEQTRLIYPKSSITSWVGGCGN